MERIDPCVIACDYLDNSEINPISECLPPGSATSYIPARKVRALFGDSQERLTVKAIFLCPCGRCERDGGSVGERSTHFNPRREQELRGEYALIYALLIHIRRPALIRIFQKHEIRLQETMYLNEGNLAVLTKSREPIVDLKQMQKRVLERQYSFLVRTLKPCSDITAISPKELLPIDEDYKPKGRVLCRGSLF